jgi:MFS family permease
MGPLLAPIAFNLKMEYNVSFTKVSLLTGWQLLTVAICGFFVSPLTRKFGKRPVIIVTSSIGFGGCIWLLYADTYNTVVGARVLQGVSVSFVSQFIAPRQCNSNFQSDSMKELALVSSQIYIVYTSVVPELRHSYFHLEHSTSW